MYTLRTFKTEGIEVNQYLGNNYEYINREVSSDAFRMLYRQAFGVDHVADLDDSATESSIDCMGFLTNEKGNLIYLSKEQTYYVMSSDGKTFSNLTYKG